MKGLKKKTLSIFGIFITAVILIFVTVDTPKYNPDRFQYTEDMKHLVTFLDGMYTIVPQGEELLVQTVLSDIIIQGTVLDDGMEDQVYLPFPYEGEGPSFTVTNIRVKIDELWFGEYEGEEVTISLYENLTNGVTKPKKDDALILFLHETGETYSTNEFENSMFIINPPNDTLFALSTREDLSEFDGKKPSDLYKSVRAELKKFSQYTEWNENIEDVGLSVLDEDSPIMVKYREDEARRAAMYGEKETGGE